jgi:hypothetical protein
VIEKLTPEQELMVPEYQRRYTNIGLNTDEVDMSVKEDLNIFYKYMEKPNPTYIYVDNLWEANVVVSSMKMLETSFPELDEAINKGDIIPREIIDDIASKIKVTSHGYNIGNINAYWVGYLQFGEKVLNIKYDYKEYDPDILNVWQRVIEKVGYFMAFEEYCIIMNRPKEVHFDENRELHNEDGTAISFRRGNECDVFAINGVRVPKQVIVEPETITLDQVLNEENAEIKRIMMDVYGMGRYLEETKASILDMDTTFTHIRGEGTMTRALMEDAEKRRYLVSTDGSTSRCYWMQVPNEVSTCVEADKALAGGRDPSKCVAVS